MKKRNQKADFFSLVNPASSRLFGFDFHQTEWICKHHWLDDASARNFAGALYLQSKPDGNDEGAVDYFDFGISDFGRSTVFSGRIKRRNEENETTLR